MADLISRSHLLSRSIPQPLSFNHADPSESAAYNFILGFETARSVIKKLIEEEPGADNAEIIRCKDCRYCQPFELMDGFYCSQWDMDFYDPPYSATDYYCGDAEAKEDA